MMHFGALEAGGTKMVLSLMNENGTMLERVSMPTLTPAETMPGMIDFFRERHIAALGIGCFGPLDLRPDSPTYGYITSTPKLPWRNYPIVGAFREALGVPVKLDTDVNGAAIAEQALGAAKGLGSCVYVTVGTGIGGGVVLDGKPVPGAEVEVESYNKTKGHTAPNEYFVTQVVKADENGVFSYGVPWAGWWGFAALNTAKEKLDYKGEPKPIELGAVLWLEFVAPKTK